MGAPLLVEYGNDVDGSLFTEEDRLGATRWNLNVRVALVLRSSPLCFFS